MMASWGRRGSRGSLRPKPHVLLTHVGPQGRRLYLLPGSPFMLRLPAPLLGFSPEARCGLVGGGGGPW